MRKALLWKSSRKRGTCKVQDRGKVLEGQELWLRTQALSCFPPLLVFPRFRTVHEAAEQREHCCRFVAWHLDNSV